MKLFIISLMLLCTACASIPEPQQRPQVKWLAVGFGCPEYEEIAPYFAARNTYGVVTCLSMSSTDDPRFTGNGDLNDYFQIGKDGQK